MANPAIDVAGVRSGKLVAVKIVGKRGTANLWLCKCDCGNETMAIATQIRRGEKTSCGCKKRERRKPRPDLVERNKNNAVHGMTNTRTYYSWRAMKYRCEWSTSKDYPNYGGRGIKICKQWSESFSRFLEDMGERPTGTTIDRIDPNGDYEPRNCRWATPKKQANNQRRSVIIEINGESRPASEWARIYGLESKTVLYRIRAGWSPLKALTTQPLIRRKYRGN